MSADEIARRKGFNRRFILSLGAFSDLVTFLSLLVSRYGRVLVVVPWTEEELIIRLRRELFPNIEILTSTDLEGKVEIWVADTGL